MNQDSLATFVSASDSFLTSRLPKWVDLFVLLLPLAKHIARIYMSDLTFKQNVDAVYSSVVPRLWNVMNW